MNLVPFANTVQRHAGLLVNTTSLGMTGEPPLLLDLTPLPPMILPERCSFMIGATALQE